MGLSNVHKQYNMQKFYKLGLTTGQPKVLSILYEKEGYLQKDLAKRCSVEPATMTSLLKKMEEKQLIFKQQESVSGGKKGYGIYLTEAGRKVAKQINEIVAESEKVCFQNFKPEEKDMFLKLMARVQNNLKYKLFDEGDL